MAGTSGTRAPLGGDSEFSPSSAESSFRELDDAFLQTQTRIWLGEVLQMRFDEWMDIGDLLADGQLLLEVSELISKMLPTPASDASHVKVNEWRSVALSKSARRYMHYDNVGSFLRTCKYLGLDGIDLFSPSDVVEKRNSRKVCMCIRSLSKKARQRGLNVPDFDSVTCTLSMPTYMVKCIRESLELSSSSISVGCGSEEVSTDRCLLITPDPASAISNGHSSDTYDDAESKFVAAGTNGTSHNACDAIRQNVPDSQLVRYGSLASELQLNNEELESDENGVCEYLSFCTTESVGSPCSHYYSDEEVNGILCSTYVGSHSTGKYLEGNSRTKYGRHNGDMNHLPIDWEETSSDFGSYIDGDANHCYCSLTRKSNTCYAPIENSSYHSEIYSEKSSYHTDKWDHSKNSIFVRRRNVDLPHEYVVEFDFCAGIAPISIIESPNSDAESCNCSCSDDDKNAEDALDANLFASVHAEGFSDNGFRGGDVKNSMHTFHLDVNRSASSVMAEDCIKCSEKPIQDVHSKEDNVLGERINVEPFNVEDTNSVNSFSAHVRLCDGQSGAKNTVSVEHTSDCQCAEESNKDESEHKTTDKEITQSKPQRRLLKSIIKGTALVTIGVFLLHLRRSSSKRNSEKPKEHRIEAPKRNTPKPSSRKAEKSSSSSNVYPAEKLSLGG